MKAQCRMFSSSVRSWDELTVEAAAFATAIGRERLINISVSAAGGMDVFGRGSEGVIFVWYWE